MSTLPSPPEPIVDEAIRVVVCDDQGGMRAAFRVILESAGIVVVGEAADGDIAVAVVRRERPHVVLMDVRMPGRDGISATTQIVAEMPRSRVLALTTFDDDDVVFGSLAAGASGFILKNSSPEDVVRAVRLVAGGDAVLDPTVAARVFARFSLLAAPLTAAEWSELRLLTERELDVLWLIAHGMTNTEIADRLGIGDATVKTHVARILSKLAVRDRVHAAISAHRCGFAITTRTLGRAPLGRTPP